MSGAGALLKSLIAADVKAVFTVPGAQNIPIHAEIFNSPDIQVVTGRTEMHVTEAAKRYAMETGRLGVVLVTTGVLTLAANWN